VLNPVNKKIILNSYKITIINVDQDETIKFRVYQHMRSEHILNKNVIAYDIYHDNNIAF
jgi:hypothetical protein